MAAELARAEAVAHNQEVAAEATTNLVLGALAAVAGAVAGVVVFYLLTKQPLSSDIEGTITFALFGVSLVFGWRATRLRTSSLNASILMWPILLVLRAWVSIIIGLPALAFYTARNLWYLFRAKRAGA